MRIQFIGKEIPFNSEKYFRLLSEKPGIVKYLSVVSKIIVNYEGVSYKINDELLSQSTIRNNKEQTMFNNRPEPDDLSTLCYIVAGALPPH